MWKKPDLSILCSDSAGELIPRWSLILRQKLLEARMLPPFYFLQNIRVREALMIRLNLPKISGLNIKLCQSKMALRQSIKVWSRFLRGLSPMLPRKIFKLVCADCTLWRFQINSAGFCLLRETNPKLPSVMQLCTEILAER